MATLLEDIVQYIIDNNLAVATGTDIFYDFEPDEPTNVIVVREYDGRGSDLPAETGCVRYVQITTRNKQLTPAKALANSIYKLFIRPDENINNLPNERWCIFSPKNTPIKLRVDNKNRIICGFNIAITTNLD